MGCPSDESCIIYLRKQRQRGNKSAMNLVKMLEGEIRRHDMMGSSYQATTELARRRKKNMMLD